MFYKTARRIVIAVVGSTVVLIGLAMTVLPGPAIVVIPAGLAILAVEFAWAGRLLKKLKQQARSIFNSPPGPDSKPPPSARADEPMAASPH